MYGLLLSELDAYDSRTEILDSYEYNKETLDSISLFIEDGKYGICKNATLVHDNNNGYSYVMGDDIKYFDSEDEARKAYDKLRKEVSGD